ncbi:hypothetical protein BLNAU_25067 [Blattamonas nauphoetae]|uniref:Uncharacterized protein n=1 Tax=Blattamonas nauphoetae TaxID=2049346 RepID=A0ABQ9WKN1_9EUKA|nr:hypothetical protein BLNAU_25067 [Blattamonas nauphoetae]
MTTRRSTKRTAIDPATGITIFIDFVARAFLSNTALCFTTKNSEVLCPFPNTKRPRHSNVALMLFVKFECVSSNCTLVSVHFEGRVFDRSIVVFAPVSCFASSSNSETSTSSPQGIRRAPASETLNSPVFFTNSILDSLGFNVGTKKGANSFTTVELTEQPSFGRIQLGDPGISPSPPPNVVTLTSACEQRTFRRADGNDVFDAVLFSKLDASIVTLSPDTLTAPIWSDTNEVSSILAFVSSISIREASQSQTPLSSDSPELDGRLSSKEARFHKQVLSFLR